MFDIRGDIAALPTAFTDDGSGVSEIRQARLVRKLVERGIGGFLVCSDAGEFTCLAFSERKNILEIVIRECQSATPVIVHASTLSTASTLDLAQHAQRHGARAAIVMPPYYGSYTQSEIEWHYRTIMQYADIPIVVADPQKRIEEETRKTLEGLSRIVFAEGAAMTDHFRLGASDAAPWLALPIDLPQRAVAALARKIDEHGGAKVLKSALEELDIEFGVPRRPLQPLNREQHAEVAAIIQECLAEQQG